MSAFHTGIDVRPHGELKLFRATYHLAKSSPPEINGIYSSVCHQGTRSMLDTALFAAPSTNMTG